MTPMVIAVDVDGTLYEHSQVAPEAVDALAAATRLGHHVVIVTGRTWESLALVIPEVLPHCLGAVCENGGVLVEIAAGRASLLHRAANPVLVDRLLQVGVAPLDVGQVALGAPTAQGALVGRVLAEVGGNEVVVQNKDSVMLLPPGCDKATGLRAALTAFGLTGAPIIAIGDAGNDLPMFAMATYPRAVANADDAVRASGFPLTAAPAGLGVAEVLHELLLGATQQQQQQQQ